MTSYNTATVCSHKGVLSLLEEMPAPTLTGRELIFCQEFAMTGNGYEAAHKAGYKQSTADKWASTLLKKPHIQTEIARVKKIVADRQMVTREEVIANLRTLRDDCMSLDKNKNFKNLKGAIRVVELLGKTCGAFEHTTTDSNVTVTVTYQDKPKGSTYDQEDDFSEFEPTTTPPVLTLIEPSNTPAATQVSPDANNLPEAPANGINGGS